MLIPFGFGHFYVGNIEMGCIKALFVLVLPVLLYALFLNLVDTNSKNKSKFLELLGKILCYTYFAMLALWYLIDVLLFMTKTYKDANGISLYG